MLEKAESVLFCPAQNLQVLRLCVNMGFVECHAVDLADLLLLAHLIGQKLLLLSNFLLVKLANLRKDIIDIVLDQQHDRLEAVFLCLRFRDDLRIDQDALYGPFDEHFLVLESLLDNLFLVLIPVEVSGTGLEAFFFAHFCVNGVQLSVLVKHLRNFLLRVKLCLVLCWNWSVQTCALYGTDL